MNKEQADKLLSMYRNNNTRETLQHFMPVEWGGQKWCAATDGHQFILIPENDSNKLEAPPGKTADIAAIIPEFNSTTEISIKKLKDGYESIPMVSVEITEPCEACEGDGKFEHYDKYYDCKSCNQTGECGTGAFKKEKNPAFSIKIGESYFSSKLIYTLIMAIDNTGSKRLMIRYQRTNNLTILELDNSILIGIMSLLEVNADNNYIVTV